MTARRRSVWRFGEALAAEFLTGRGIIIERANVRSGPGEIDLLGLDRGRDRVAIEVKTVASNDRGADPLAAADAAKLAVVRAAAAALRPPVWRIDLVGVVIGDEGVSFRWMRDVDW